MAPTDAAPTHVEAKAQAAPAARPSLVTLRVGAGLGAGNNGMAGSLFAAGDVWPWSRFGLGVEGSSGGSAGFSLGGPSEGGSLLAVRLRFSGRIVLASGAYFSGALAAGVARQVIEHHDGDSGCDGWLEDCPSDYQPEPEPLVAPRQATAVPTGALELAFQGRLVGPIEIGIVLRGEVGPEVGFVTLGPLLGARF